MLLRVLYSTYVWRVRACMCVFARGERHGTDTRQGVQRSLTSPVAALCGTTRPPWFHSWLHWLIFVRPVPAQPEVDAHRVDGPFPLRSLHAATLLCVFIEFWGGSDHKRNTTDNLRKFIPRCSNHPISWFVICICVCIYIYFFFLELLNTRRYLDKVMWRVVRSRFREIFVRFFFPFFLYSFIIFKINKGIKTLMRV